MPNSWPLENQSLVHETGLKSKLVPARRRPKWASQVFQNTRTLAVSFLAKSSHALHVLLLVSGYEPTIARSIDLGSWPQT